MAGALQQISPITMAHVISRKDRSRPSLSPHRAVVKATAMSTKQVQLQPYWTSINADIEKHLKQAVQMKDPVIVSRPLHHLTFAAPPTTAPALCVAACELVGGHREQAIAAASALHLMHAAFFTHEHIQPSDDFRLMGSVGNRRTHAYSSGIELMTGDAMIPLAFELLARSDDPTRNQSDQILKVMREIGRVTSTQGMIYGKYLKKYCCDQTMVLHACEYYEGVLHACAAACGAILGGGREEEVERVRRFGGYVGKIQGLRMLKIRMEEFDMDLTGLVEELRSCATKELDGFDDQEKVGELIANITKLEGLAN